MTPSAMAAPVAPPGAGEAARPSVNASADLATRTAVHDLVVDFYREIVFDEVLEPIFGDVAEVDWAEHIPKLIDYWCFILLDEDVPHGNVTKVHRHLHGLEPLRQVHCDRWFSLWVASIDAQWVGPIADHAKSHAEHLMVGLAKHVFGFIWTAPPTGALAS